MEEKKFKFYCEKCNFGVDYQSKWDVHLETKKHKGIEEPIKRPRKKPYKEPSYKCDKCNQVFSCKGNYDYHVNNRVVDCKTGKPKVEYDCDCGCGQKLYSKTIYENHQEKKIKLFNEKKDFINMLSMFSCTFICRHAYTLKRLNSGNIDDSEKIKMENLDRSLIKINNELKIKLAERMGITVENIKTLAGDSTKWANFFKKLSIVRESIFRHSFWDRRIKEEDNDYKFLFHPLISLNCNYEKYIDHLLNSDNEYLHVSQNLSEKIINESYAYFSPLTKDKQYKKDSEDTKDDDIKQIKTIPINRKGGEDYKNECQNYRKQIVNAIRNKCPFHEIHKIYIDLKKAEHLYMYSEKEPFISEYLEASDLFDDSNTYTQPDYNKLLEFAKLVEKNKKTLLIGKITYTYDDIYSEYIKSKKKTISEVMLMNLSEIKNSEDEQQNIDDKLNERYEKIIFQIENSKKTPKNDEEEDAQKKEYMLNEIIKTKKKLNEIIKTKKNLKENFNEEDSAKFDDEKRKYREMFDVCEIKYKEGEKKGIFDCYGICSIEFRKLEDLHFDLFPRYKI
jgi:hypothetical protein